MARAHDAFDAPPAWAYPLNLTAPARALERVEAPRSVPGSHVTLAASQLHDPYYLRDWFPSSHPRMPSIVAYGHKPDVWPCAACHQPNGQGKPENAALAGLPFDYIVQQVVEMREGRRRSAQPKMLSAAHMVEIARTANMSDVKTAARYFSALVYSPKIRVVETEIVPRTYTGGISMLAPVPGGGTEPLGERIVEVPENFGLTELGDWQSGFVAYVPRGSIRKGEALVKSGDGALPCRSCHGPDLKGNGSIPPLAGRPPSYLVRQLFDMQHGARSGPAVAPMLAEVAHMSDADRIAIVAYLASLRS